MDSKVFCQAELTAGAVPLVAENHMEFDINKANTQRKVQQEEEQPGRFTPEHTLVALCTFLLQSK